jgi:hypothetical protein
VMTSPSSSIGLLRARAMSTSTPRVTHRRDALDAEPRDARGADEVARVVAVVEDVVDPEMRGSCRSGCRRRSQPGEHVVRTRITCSREGPSPRTGPATHHVTRRCAARGRRRLRHRHAEPD